MKQCTSQFRNKTEHIDHIENFHKKEYFKLNYDEYLISQVFHNDFIPYRINKEARKHMKKRFGKKKLNVFMKTVYSQFMQQKEVILEIY
jgi:hypothetical protein